MESEKESPKGLKHLREIASLRKRKRWKKEWAKRSILTHSING
jgi:hypothetical protein